VVFGIIEGPGSGWTSPKIVGIFGLCIAALVGLIWYEPRRDEPLIDLRFFRSAPFSGATVIAVSSFAALGGFLFVNTLYLQEVRGFSALHAGLCTLPMAAMTVVFAPLSGRLVGARGPRTPLLVAGAAMTISGIMLTQLTAHTPLSWLIFTYVVFGFGFAMVNPPITTTAVSGMPLSQAGVAAATASTSRQVGQSLGVAITGSVVAVGASQSGFSEASRTGWWIISGYGAVVFVLGILTTGRWARRTAERTAARLIPEETKIPVKTP
jgi:MFS family permease